MRYLPTIDIDAAGISDALRSGQLRLQCGQWIRCGLRKASRFVRASSTTVYAVHPTGPFGTVGVSRSQFSMAARLWK